MKRRDFLKNIGLAGAGVASLNGIPVRAMAEEQLKKFFGGTDNDQVLIMIQLHGGNDGLNTLIPIGNYSKYYDIRANVAIPEDGTRAYINLDSSMDEAEQVGLHPDMAAIKELWDEHRAGFVQAVGYDNMNMSHFRSRDIWFMGGSYNEVKDSGWMGRFLDEEYPGYPDGYPNEEMEDPLGLELGNAVTLAFQRSNSIPAGISLQNPDAFYDLIESVGVNPPGNDSFPDSYYGDELEYLMQFEKKTNQYAARLKEIYDAGENASGISYPNSYPFETPVPYIKNPLAEQLKIIARLISGGSKTRFFLARLTGFDTHASQVEDFDPTKGRHAALLYHISTAVKAFYDDLKKQKLDHRVVTMTYSEFGRRAYSNASYGTDHGKAAPIMLFGPGVKRKVHGNNPDLDDLDGGNLRHQFDYRQVYNSVLLDWMGASETSLIEAGMGDYIDNRLDIFHPTTSTTPIFERKTVHELDDCWPNPVQNDVKFRFRLAETDQVRLALYSSAGRLIEEYMHENLSAGEYTHDANLSNLRAGNYIYRLSGKNFSLSKMLIVTR